MLFDSVINNILKEEDFSREDKLNALKSLKDIKHEQIKLVFYEVTREADGDGGYLSTSAPNVIITTEPGSELINTYFKEWQRHHPRWNVLLETSKLWECVFAVHEKSDKALYDMFSLIQGESETDEKGDTYMYPEITHDVPQGWSSTDMEEWKRLGEDELLEYLRG